MNNLSIKQFKKDQYDLIKSWWDEYNEPCAPLEFFPETTYVSYHNDKPVFCASLILSNTPTCWMTAPIADPKFKDPVRKDLFESMLSHLYTVAKDHKKSIIFTMNDKPSLITRFTELGFIPVSANMTIFNKRI